MASKARLAFNKNAEDISRLIELHALVGGIGPGRRRGLEVLNKSAIVLITAIWEAYCEDIASEGLEHIVKYAKSAEAIPVELKKIITRNLKSSAHELEIWKVADGGWRIYLTEHLEKLKEERDRRLNTPKTAQINELFKSALGIEKISTSWKWDKKMTAARAADKLDKYVTLRGAIAHRGSNDKPVIKANVTDYFDFIKSIVSKTGGAVNRHVKSTTGKKMW